MPAGDRYADCCPFFETMESLFNDAKQRKLRMTNLPDVYVEKTPVSFSTSPQRVKLCGGLSKRWSTLCVYRLIMHIAGAFVVYNLHRSPHYQEDRNRRNFINARAKTVGADVVDVKERHDEPNRVNHGPDAKGGHQQGLHKGSLQGGQGRVFPLFPFPPLNAAVVIVTVVATCRRICCCHDEVHVMGCGRVRTYFG